MTEPNLDRELPDGVSEALPEPEPASGLLSSTRAAPRSVDAIATKVSLGLGETQAATGQETVALKGTAEPENGVREIDEPVARSFGDYTLIGKLASGGMGVVYLARQERLRRTVALKMIRSGDHASAEEIHRFRQEAQAAAQLDHPGIVPIFEVGEDQGQPYFSMGYVEGGSLSARVKRGPLPPREAVELVRQVTEAVAYAHHRGIIHRDLKPGNILLDRDGNAKVTDFGLAKQVSGLSHLTMPGQILGTPSYMAPEQAAGKPDEVGRAADLYSLGATLYCLVTGRPPFQAATPLETLRQVLEEEPVSPRQLNASVGRDLETICLKCLQKEPARRYESAPALAEDLRRFLAGEPIRARPVGGIERLGRWCRRNRMVAALGGGFVLSLLIGLAGTSYFAVREQREATAARASEARAMAARELSERRWYAAEMGLAQQDWEKGQIASVLSRLEALRPDHFDAPDPRGFEWYYLHRLCHLESRTLVDAEPVRSVAFSPDGRHLASCGGRSEYGKPGAIRIWDAATGAAIRTLAGHAECVNAVAFSPDGTRIASGGGLANRPGEVKIWDAATGRELLSVRGQAGPVWSVAFSPDGRRLAASAGGYDDSGISLPGKVLIWDLPRETPFRVSSGHESVVKCVAFSPKGRWLASADEVGIVKIWDAARGEAILTLETLDERSSAVTSVAFSPDDQFFAAGGLDRSIRVWDASLWGKPATASPRPILRLQHPSPVRGVAFSPDGRRLAAAYDDHTARVWDLTTRTEILILRGHRDAVSGVAFSPDGWRLASAGMDQTVKVWDATRDRSRVPFRDHQGPVSAVGCLAFSPDRRWLASAADDRTVRIWDTTSALVVRTLRGHTDTINGVAFSADSRWLASGGMDRTIHIWNTATGEQVRTLRGFPAPVTSVAFAPDGRWLACSTGGRKTAGAVHLRDLATDQELLPPVPDDVRSARPGFYEVAFSPDGQWLAAGCDDATIRVWDLAARGTARTLGGHAARVRGVAFSPDGRWLASASDDRSVKLWDVATGAAIATLPGHTAPVWSVAFSPDGRRLASAGSDFTVKLWDPRTAQQDSRAQELSNFPVPWTLLSIAFHPDGKQLAIGGRLAVGSDLAIDHTLAIWDARDLAPDLGEQDEARGRLAFWFARTPTADPVRQHLVRDPALGDRVRERALALVDAYGEDVARREAEDLIRELYRDGSLRSEVLGRLRDDPRLSEPVRRQALALAGPSVESAATLIKASRAVVSRPGAEPSSYRRALLQAETACQLTPYHVDYRTTLGMAQYRVGKAREAVETLAGADQLPSTPDRTTNPAGLAFLAMARYQIGRRDEAQATLDRLRSVLQKTPPGDQKEAIAFRLEAERLIENSPTPLP